jgi:spermidine/putrescine transport system permease protein
MTIAAPADSPAAATRPAPRRVSRLGRLLHRSEAARGYLLLSPALLLLTVAIMVPLGAMVLMSLWSVSGYDIDTTLTLQNYQAMTTNPMYAVLVGRSLTVAATATVITVILCYPMAYFVAFHVHRHKALWLIIMTLPFWTSYLLRVFSWRVVLGQEGVINSALLSLGLIEAPLSFLLYSQTAVTIVLAHSWAAFALLPIYVSLEKINRTYIEAAADLGDGPFHRFWRIILPLSLPGVVSAFFLMFIPTMGDYITPAMVGGPDAMLAGNLIQASFGPMNNVPAGAALALVLTLAIAVSALVFLGLTRLIRR